MLTIITGIILAIILYQDVRWHAVHWILFVLLALGSVGVSYFTLHTFEVRTILYNFLFLFTMLAGLTIYLSLKNKKWINITDGFFCWGDILFLLAVLPLFHFRMYVLFFTAGTFSTLIIHLLRIIIKKEKENVIPYAGYMSLFTLAVLLFYTQFNQLTNQLF